MDPLLIPFVLYTDVFVDDKKLVFFQNHVKDKQSLLKSKNNKSRNKNILLVLISYQNLKIPFFDIDWN